MPLITNDPVVLNEWIVCANENQLAVQKQRDTIILGQKARITFNGEQEYKVLGLNDDGSIDRELPCQRKYQHIFTTFGNPERDIPTVPEFDKAVEEGRELSYTGALGIKATAYRLIENFCDMAHFPFVHTGIIGDPDRPEILRYKAKHLKDTDELLATKCQVFKPGNETLRQGETAAEGGIMYNEYRIMSPLSCLLTTSESEDFSKPSAIGLWVQPVNEYESIAYVVQCYPYSETPIHEQNHLQHCVMSQDRMILESQPPLLPLAWGTEIPAICDQMSIAFRKWLRDKNADFGIQKENQSAQGV